MRKRTKRASKEELESQGKGEMKAPTTSSGDQKGENIIRKRDDYR